MSQPKRPKALRSEGAAKPSAASSLLHASFLLAASLSLGVVGALLAGSEASAQTALDLDATPPIDTTTQSAPSGDTLANPRAGEALDVQQVDDAALEAAQAAETAAQTKNADTQAPRSTTAQVQPLTAGSQQVAQRLRRPAPPPTILLRDIRFTPSGYLTAQEIATAEAALVGKRYRLDQLQQVADAITALYVAKNIALANANITGADVANGTLDVELFEARLGAVSYETGYLSDAYMRFRLGLKSGELADNRRINARLERLALTDNLVFGANFNPGQTRGLTNLAIAADPGRRFGGSISADSYGTSGSGVYRLTGTATANSITGWNDPLTLSATLRERAFNGSVSYSRVIHSEGSRLGLTASYSQSNNGQTPLLEEGGLSVLGQLTVPIVVTPSTRFGLTAQAQYFTANNEFAGTRILQQAGLAGSLGVFGSRTGRFADSERGWSLGGSVAAVYGSYDDPVFSISDQSFGLITGSANASAALSKDYVASIGLSGQVALNSNGNPNAYDITVTSPFAVRGYPVSQSSGDSGFVLRSQIERATPLPGLPSGFSLRPFVFADVGQAFTVFGGNVAPQGIATSVGAGLSFNLLPTVLAAGASQEEAESGTPTAQLFGDVFIAKPLTSVTGYSVNSNDFVVRGSITAAF